MKYDSCQQLSAVVVKLNVEMSNENMTVVSSSQSLSAVVIKLNVEMSDWSIIIVSNCHRDEYWNERLEYDSC